MRRKTSTQQLQNAISNNLLQVVKAEVYYKTSRKTETVDVVIFQENFGFLCESGIFAESLGWHYERNHKSESYILETGRYNPHSEIIITVYLKAGENANREDIEKELLFLED